MAVYISNDAAKARKSNHSIYPAELYVSRTRQSVNQMTSSLSFAARMHTTPSGIILTDMQALCLCRVRHGLSIRTQFELFHFVCFLCSFHACVYINSTTF